MSSVYFCVMCGKPYKPSEVLYCSKCGTSLKSDIKSIGKLNAILTDETEKKPKFSDILNRAVPGEETLWLVNDWKQTTFVRRFGRDDIDDMIKSTELYQNGGLVYLSPGNKLSDIIRKIFKLGTKFINPAVVNHIGPKGKFLSFSTSSETEAVQSELFENLPAMNLFIDHNSTIYTTEAFELKWAPEINYLNINVSSLEKILQVNSFNVFKFSDSIAQSMQLNADQRDAEQTLKRHKELIAKIGLKPGVDETTAIQMMLGTHKS